MPDYNMVLPLNKHKILLTNVNVQLQNKEKYFQNLPSPAEL